MRPGGGTRRSRWLIGWYCWRAGGCYRRGRLPGLYDRPDTLANACRLGAANVLAGRIVSVENDVALVRLECGPEIEADPPHRDVPAG